MNRGFYNRCFGAEFQFYDRCWECKYEFECYIISEKVEENEKYEIEREKMLEKMRPKDYWVLEELKSRFIDTSRNI